MQDRRDVGQEWFRTEEMQNRRDAGQEGCRTGEMQDRRDVGQEWFRTGVMQDRRDAGHERCRTREMQGGRDVRQEGCRTWGMQDRRNAFTVYSIHYAPVCRDDICTFFIVNFSRSCTRREVLMWTVTVSGKVQYCMVCTNCDSRESGFLNISQTFVPAHFGSLRSNWMQPFPHRGTLWRHCAPQSLFLKISCVFRDLGSQLSYVTNFPKLCCMPKPYKYPVSFWGHHAIAMTRQMWDAHYA